MAISLSSGVRQSLQSLQSTATMAQTAQQRLATGKKVNSAIDNPTNFFTAGSLNNRAESLSGLLDGMSNAVQTIQSASTGIDGITKLVKSAQSTIKQALADAAANRPTSQGTAIATVGEAATTGLGLQDVALNKKLEGAAAAATSTTSGNLGIAAGSTVTLAAGNTTYSFSTDANMTVRDLISNINKSGIATASVDSNGKFSITGAGSDALTFNVEDSAAGDGNAALGLTTGIATTGITATANSATRTSLISQFNDLRTQIDQLAKDAGFNGTNLLDGNQMKVVFNEKTGAKQNSLTVKGQQISSESLGIQQAANAAVSGQTNFQNDTDLNAAADSLTNALTTLNSLSSTLGANLSTVQTRQDFAKSMIDNLKNGADNLVNADTNEEGANLLALQTRQQLSQTALSLSSQADQAVLRLF